MQNRLNRAWNWIRSSLRRPTQVTRISIQPDLSSSSSTHSSDSPEIKKTPRMSPSSVAASLENKKNESLSPDDFLIPPSVLNKEDLKELTLALDRSEFRKDLNQNESYKKLKEILKSKSNSLAYSDVQLFYAIFYKLCSQYSKNKTVNQIKFTKTYHLIDRFIREYPFFKYHQIESEFYQFININPPTVRNSILDILRTMDYLNVKLDKNLVENILGFPTTLYEIDNFLTSHDNRHSEKLRTKKNYISICCCLHLIDEKQLENLKTIFSPDPINALIPTLHPDAIAALPPHHKMSEQEKMDYFLEPLLAELAKNAMYTLAQGIHPPHSGTSLRIFAQNPIADLNVLRDIHDFLHSKSTDKDSGQDSEQNEDPKPPKPN